MKPYGGERSNWAAIAGVIALGVLTLVLIFLALKTGRAEVPNEGETPGYQPSQTEQSGSVPSEEGTPASGEETTASGAATVPPLSRVLSMQDANVVYRAVTGPCPETTAVIENTHDGGVSWTNAEMSVYGAISSPLRILSGSDGYVSVAAQNGEDCASVVVLQSYSFGSTWEYVPDGGTVTWHISPTDPSVINVPGVGAVQAPCEAARLSTSSATSAAILCADTRMATTGDSGANWSVSEPFLGAEAIAASGEAFLLAQTGTADCDGTLVSQVSTNHSVLTSACVPVAAPGQTAIAAATDGTAWLWAGETVAKSSDSGVTW